MKNALEQYRQAHGMSYADIARVVETDRATVMRHCKAESVPESAVARYHVRLQIPIEDLRPQLFKGTSTS